jgi:hypothetical protein
MPIVKKVLKGIFSSAVSSCGDGAKTAGVDPLVEEAKGAAMEAAHDTARGLLAGRTSCEKWAKMLVPSVDKIKERIIEEDNLCFVGGNLKFAMSTETAKSIAVSFELYFQDDANKWHKAEAESEMSDLLFKHDDLQKMQTDGEIVFEVE